MAIPGYKILRKIRQGGMSTVYLAIQKSMDREVAIKVMSPALNNDPTFGSRFYREAKIVGKLSHPNIVSIYDVGSYKHYNYIAMDYLPGASLQERIKKQLSLNDTLTIIREIASALNYSHQQGIIHRDIKPDNILFRADGSAVLCDFGIAKSVKNDNHMTSSGSTMGTPIYMSPEQAQGKTLDNRADLYSLGVVFYEMLTGKPPFYHEDPISIAVMHMTSAIPKLPPQLKIFQAIINQLLAKKPTHRFQTGKALIEAIDHIQPKIHRASHTQQSTSITVPNLVQALLQTLSSVIYTRIKRVFINRRLFSRPAIEISEQQLQQLDDFVLHDNETAIPHSFITVPIIKTRRLWLYFPASLLALLMTGFIYVYDYHPETAQYTFQQLKALSKLSTTATISAKPPESMRDQFPPTATHTIVRNTSIADVIEKDFPLTINTMPNNATVRILNIKARYTPEIRLAPGNYHIEVSAKNYHSKHFWLRIDDQGMEKTVELKATRKLLAAGTIIHDQLSDGSDGPEMVVIPPGSLTINSNTEPYELVISEKIAIGRTEVTFADFDKFSQATNQQPIDDQQWGRINRPVINIDRDTAIAYAQWLSEQTKQQYRLPSAIEWEYAYRANTLTDYWWGNEKNNNVANCRRGCNSQWSKFFSSSTAPVASFQANTFGLYDIAGNVAEWLSDCVKVTPATQTCETGVIAGGSHKSSLKTITANSHIAQDSNQKNTTTGLRLVLEL